MASTIHPFVKVSLDKERHLCYGAAAFIEFKEATGVDLLRYMKTLASRFSAMAPEKGQGSEIGDFEIPFKEFRDVLWAGLIHEDPSLTLRDVSNMFSLHNMMDLVPAVMEAFTLSMPTAKNGAASENPRLAPVKAKK